MSHPNLELEQQQEENQQESQESPQESQSQAAQPTSVIDASLAQQLIREANENARIARENNALLQQQLEEARRPKPIEPRRFTPEQFLEDPQAVIREEIQAANALTQQRQDDITRRATNYRNFKITAINNQPKLASHAAQLFDLIDNYIDQNQEVTLAMVNRALAAAVGDALLRGDVPQNPVLNTPQNTTQNTQTERPVSNNPPPTIRNAPAAPRQETKLRTLSDNEERARQVFGMTHEQYIKELDGDDTMTVLRENK